MVSLGWAAAPGANRGGRRLVQGVQFQCVSKRHREGAEIRSAIHDAKARQSQVSLDDLELENGSVDPINGIRRIERNVWELIQCHALQNKGSRRWGLPEDDWVLFAEFLSFRECISHFGGIGDNALFVLGNCHPCSRGHVLEKFTEVGNWRRHYNSPSPSKSDAKSFPIPPHSVCTIRAEQIKKRTVHTSALTRDIRCFTQPLP